MLTGKDITRITGIEAKSWDPERFASFAPIVDVVREALANAGTSTDDIDLVVVMTATPLFPQLGADGFELMRLLGFRDDVPPIQLQAGCAGMARAMQFISESSAERPLIVAYEVSSRYMESRVYFENATHPRKDTLWLSPALFSDGAAALVLRRDTDGGGLATYSRDSHAFGGEPGFQDPLVEYAGGGAHRPPGTPGADDMAVFAMNGEATRRYYAEGMMLNHRTLEEASPGYLHAVKRVYMHQASPRLVGHVRELLMRDAGARPEQLPTNAHEIGNLVVPATLKLLSDDVAAGSVGPGDDLCFSVVGAGPERGSFLISMAEASP
ncbi:MAG: 3-oxoacyl-[acyl-carrier-protein] synthase III C-terminal domain-containing protein [Nocardioides sp.]